MVVMDYLAITGRQEKLAQIELEAVFSLSNITTISDYAVLIQADKQPPQSKLGGAIKIGRVLATVEKADLAGAFKYLAAIMPEKLEELTDGKLKFGVSVYGFNPRPDWLLKNMLELKKVIRKQGRSVRIIQNNTPELSSAQVLYNKLTAELGWELLLVKDGSDVIVAQTLSVQDIDAYAKRDHGRPARDAKVGMLPPKLAQIMINLARPEKGSLVYDPFCGTGVVLQEAHLAGCKIAGSDLEPRMIDYTKQNLTWLDEKLSDTPLTVADAKTVDLPDDIGAIVSEMFLGQPLFKPPANTHLDELLDENYDLLVSFLENIAKQTKTGTPLCVAIPAWSQSTGFTSVLNQKLSVDHLKKLGYNTQKFSYAKPEDLIYAREDQIVGRQLLVLRRN